MTVLHPPQPRRPFHVPSPVLFAVIGLIALAGIIAAMLRNQDSGASVSPPDVKVDSAPPALMEPGIPSPIFAYIVNSEEGANAAFREINESYGYDVEVGRPGRQSEVYIVAEGEGTDTLIQQLYADANSAGRELRIIYRRFR